MSIGFGEIFVILVLGLLLFGAKKLPETGRAFGKAIKEFKKGLNFDDDDSNLDKVNKDSD